MIYVIHQISNKIGAGKCDNKILSQLTNKIAYLSNTKSAKNMIKNIGENDTVIFIYNEDALHCYNKFRNFIRELIKIEKNLKTEKIYNRPSKFKLYGCKHRFYKKLEQQNFIPKFCQLNSLDNIQNVNFYPNIVTLTLRSHGKGRELCNKHNITEQFSKLNKIKKKTKYEQIIAVEFIDSFNKDLNSYINVRLMVINNKLLEYYVRPSSKWNTHNSDIIDNKKINKKITQYFDEWYKNHSDEVNRMLEICYKKLGKGFYSYDTVLSIKNDRLYICEVGLKLYDYSLLEEFKKMNLLNEMHDKLLLDKNKYVSKMKELMS